MQDLRAGSLYGKKPVRPQGHTPALLAYFALIGAVWLVMDGNYLRRPRRSIRLR
jgi:hypothetical protein